MNVIAPGRFAPVIATTCRTRIRVERAYACQVVRGHLANTASVRPRPDSCQRTLAGRSATCRAQW